MLNDRRIWLILGALALSLLLNVVALLRISDVRDDIEQVRGQTANVSGLQGDVSSINARIDQLIDDQAWISDVHWTIDPQDGNEDCQGDVPVSGTISFREIGRNADVSVEFREADSADWQRTEASAAGDVDYRVSTTLSLDSTWEYRVVAETEDGLRTAEPRPLDDLHPLTDHGIFFEYGESRQQDGDRRVRFVVDNHSPRVSPCNEIVNATLELSDGDEVVDSIDMQPEYPGHYEPDGFDAPEAPAEADEVRDDSILGYSERDDDRTVWWSDWVPMDESYEPVVIVEFGDGSTRTIDRIGAH